MKIDMLYDASFFTPVLVLILWTLLMWVWMYATRIPAMQKAKIDPQDAISPASGNWRSKIPNEVHWKADNYNHLHEQPTIFYALMFFTGLTAGSGDTFLLVLAWAYVILRIAHSIVQVTVNKVMIRFILFALSSLVLIVFALKEAVRIFF